MQFECVNNVGSGTHTEIPVLLKLATLVPHRQHQRPEGVISNLIVDGQSNTPVEQCAEGAGFVPLGRQAGWDGACGILLLAQLHHAVRVAEACSTHYYGMMTEIESTINNDELL